MSRDFYRLWSAEEIGHLRALWEAGYPADQIAAMMDRPRGSITGKVHHLKIKRVVRVKRDTAPFTKTERNKALFADYLGGMTAAECAEKYGLTPEGVRGLLNRYKVRLPSSVRAKRLSECAKRARPSPGRPPVWPDCPEHLRRDYDRFRKHYGFRSAEARAMLEVA